MSNKINIFYIYIIKLFLNKFGIIFAKRGVPPILSFYAVIQNFIIFKNFLIIAYVCIFYLRKNRRVIIYRQLNYSIAMLIFFIKQAFPPYKNNKPFYKYKYPTKGLHKQALIFFIH
jgi:hypothetical protein